LAAGDGAVHTGTSDEGLDSIGEGYIAGGLVLRDVSAVLILNAKESPHASTGDFHEGDHEGDDGGVLGVVGENGIKDPGKSKDRIYHHDEVV
jgi:hypothetical protein